MLCDQRFIGGHDRHTAAEQLRDDRARRLDRAERFDDDVVVAVEERGRLRRQSRQRTVARAINIAHECPLDMKPDARMRGCRSIGGEPRDRLANLAEPEDADANGADRRCGTWPWSFDAQGPRAMFWGIDGLDGHDGRSLSLP